MQELSRHGNGYPGTLEKTTSTSDFVKMVRVSNNNRNPQVDADLCEKLEKLNKQKDLLNNENMNLRVELDRMKHEFHRLDECEYENEKLKQELDQIREQNRQELCKLNSKLEYELKTQAENFRIRAKHEEAQREELKKKYQNELNAAKIRYENELSKQNGLMQAKYDNLTREICGLNQIVNKLKGEKKDLICQIQYEKELNKELIRKLEFHAFPKQPEKFEI